MNVGLCGVDGFETAWYMSETEFDDDTLCMVLRFSSEYAWKIGGALVSATTGSEYAGVYDGGGEGSVGGGGGIGIVAGAGAGAGAIGTGSNSGSGSTGGAVTTGNSA
jgi:hypothetical protein